MIVYGHSKCITVGAVWYGSSEVTVTATVRKQPKTEETGGALTVSHFKKIYHYKVMFLTTKYEEHHSTLFSRNSYRDCARNSGVNITLNYEYFPGSRKITARGEK